MKAAGTRRIKRATGQIDRGLACTAVLLQSDAEARIISSVNVHSCIPFLSAST